MRKNKNLSILLMGLTLAFTMSVSNGWAGTITATSGLLLNGSFESPGPPFGQFNFSGDPFDPLKGITNVKLAGFTLFDGDTAPGNFDFNDWTLALDGIDTGIKLNGFPNNGAGSITVSGAFVEGSALALSLQTALGDGIMVASILDADPGDGNDAGPWNNQIKYFFVGGPMELELTGVSTPEPASFLLMGSGLLGFAAWQWKRAKHESQ